MPEYQPLFLKYRPQALADLIGQDSVARTLANAIEHDRIFHAYLFTGPRGTGKTSSARILAKSLNCINGPTVSPCQVCAACEEIRQGISPSVFEIDAASNNSVDDARLLIERAPLIAPGGRFKIYIIDECHMLTKEAFNALLKTIEEPPANVVFVLATTEEQKVPPTIVSRCQRLMFRLVHQNALAAYLETIAAKEAIAIDQDAIALIARRAAGGLRDAIGLLDQSSLLGAPGQPVKIQDLLLLSGSLSEDMVLAIGESILNRDGEGSLKAIAQLLEDGREPHLIASELAKHFLNLAKASYLTNAAGLPEERLKLSGSPEYIERLITQAGRLHRSELAAMVESLDRLEQTCKRSSQPGLNLEVGILSCCHRLDRNELKSLQERVTVLERELNDGVAPDSALPQSPAVVKPDKMPTLKPSEKVRLFAPAEDPQPDEKPVEEVVGTRAQAPLDGNFQDKEASAATVTASRDTALAASDDALPELIDSVIVENIAEKANPQVLQTDSAEFGDVDYLWSELLEELQRRNIPTYSLVSTHAFPLALSSTELTIGVLVEHFQKMIEGKLEHIKAALQTIKGPVDLAVKVKISGQSKHARPPKESSGGASVVASGRGSGQSVVSRGSDTENPIESLVKSSVDTAKIKGNKTDDAGAELTEQPVVNHSLRASLKSTTVHMVQEAYKLFEGPGSRLITST